MILKISLTFNWYALYIQVDFQWILLCIKPLDLLKHGSCKITLVKTQSL